MAGGPAFAGPDTNELIRWQTLDAGWRVNYEPAKNLCSLSRPYRDDTSLTVWIHPERGWTMRFTNPAWTSIVANQNYTVHLHLDGNTDKWTADDWRGIWTTKLGQPGIMIDDLKIDFMWWFIEPLRVDIFNGNKWMTALMLDGSYNGMVALIECQRVHGPGQQQQPAPKRNRENWS